MPNLWVSPFIRITNSYFWNRYENIVDINLDNLPVVGHIPSNTNTKELVKNSKKAIYTGENLPTR